MGLSEDTIYSLISKMKNGEPIKEVYGNLSKSSLPVLPDDVFRVMHRLMQESGKPEDMLPVIGKAMNLLHNKLSLYQWEKPAEGTFLYYLMEENIGLVKHLEEYKESRGKSTDAPQRSGWLYFIGKLSDYNVQLLKLENILFPELEKRDSMFEGLAMLWAMHDKARGMVRDARMLFEGEQVSQRRFVELLGELYFMFYGLVQKQELLLFPAAASWIPQEVMDGMQIQADVFGYAFVERSLDPEKHTLTSNGGLNKQQLDGVLRSLPFDITFVNEKDEVAFFSEGERIFPRSGSVIGRKVQNCHPPKSMDAVTAILEGFKNNESNIAEFWIEHHGKKVLIKYSAVRDGSGNYLGTLEITQDITQIQRLEGEKRL